MSTQTLEQDQDADRELDVRNSMRAAAAKVSRDQSRARFLQKVGKKILVLVGSTRGVDQIANLKTQVNAKVDGESCNLSNLEAAIRDSGWAVTKSFLEVSQPQKAKNPSAELAAEYENIRRAVAVLRNSLAIGAPESELRRVNRVIDENGD